MAETPTAGPGIDRHSATDTIDTPNSNPAPGVFAIAGADADRIEGGWWKVERYDQPGMQVSFDETNGVPAETASESPTYVIDTTSEDGETKGLYLVTAGCLVDVEGLATTFEKNRASNKEPADIPMAELVTSGVVVPLTERAVFRLPPQEIGGVLTVMQGDKRLRPEGKKGVIRRIEKDLHHPGNHGEALSREPKGDIGRTPFTRAAKRLNYALTSVEVQEQMRRPLNKDEVIDGVQTYIAGKLRETPASSQGAQTPGGPEANDESKPGAPRATSEPQKGPTTVHGNVDGQRPATSTNAPESRDGPEQAAEGPHIVQFNDGQLALGFRTPGESVDLGPASQQKWARHVGEGGIDRAIVFTKSGRTYAVADGSVLDIGTGVVAGLRPDATVTVTVGEQPILPGANPNDEVTGVLLRYTETTPQTKIGGAEQVDLASPFTTIQDRIDAGREAQAEKVPEGFTPEHYENIKDLWRETKLLLEMDAESPEAQEIQRRFGDLQDLNMNLDTGLVTDLEGRQHSARELAHWALDTREAREAAQRKKNPVRRALGRIGLRISGGNDRATGPGSLDELRRRRDALDDNSDIDEHEQAA